MNLPDGKPLLIEIVHQINELFLLQVLLHRLLCISYRLLDFSRDIHMLRGSTSLWASKKMEIVSVWQTTCIFTNSNHFDIMSEIHL